MAFDLSSALPLILLGVVLLVLAAWLLSRLNRKAKVLDDGTAPTLTRDVLDEGAERAKRNQALIDAPLSVALTQGQLSAAANSQQVAATSMDTDAEAGPQVKPAPVPVRAPAPATVQTSAAADDITRIKGVGPKLVALLGELGVTSYAQIAAWSDADVERIDAELGRFKGRITRDQWIAQATLLAAGDEAAFTDKFGRNG